MWRAAGSGICKAYCGLGDRNTRVVSSVSLGVGVGSGFDDRARSVLGKSQVSGCGADLILGNLGSSQGWSEERGQ